ncbi:uncharacterized protein LOC119796437 [Cyprinodon tularosa]|uniref:uncharacterized protein LOC119796437 n=1 Tax=Cyprinodon tularosa TaxID=77115 RepID=UPI0018E21FB2|nr:uncharacterized protein LOC119796437 [Cyprinodon tularosa]
MTDKEFSRYIPSYGDRLAIASFCRRMEANFDKEGILNRIRQTIETRRMMSKRHVEVPQQTSVGNSGLMAKPKNSNAVKSKRRIEVGWLHFQSGDFHQVRSKCGGGTRHLEMEKTTTVSEVMTTAKELFFPGGLSSKGSIMDFTLSMCDFKRQAVPLDSTLSELYEQFKSKMVRLYLCTKELEHSSEDQNDLFEQPPNVGRVAQHSTSAPSAEPLTSMKSLQGYTSGEAGHSSQYLITDEALLSPQHRALPDGTEGHDPVYVIR